MIKRKIKAIKSPKHPPGPEAKVRLAIARLFIAYHRHIIKVILAHTRRNDAKHLGLHAGLMGARAQGHRMEQQTRLRSATKQASAQTASDVVDHLSQALKQPELNPDLSLIESEYVSRIADGVDARMDLSIERAQDILDEWEGLDPDTSPRAGDQSALALMLSVGLDGILGGMLSESSVAFGYLFGQLNRATQEEAGVEKYVWRTQHDAHVREAHADLEGVECDWDDPPLSGDESSSGEDCHPGEDFNCRCTPDPIEPAETAEESEAKAA